MRLLVVEDIPIFTSLVNQLLAAEGVQLDFAGELEDGVQKTLANTYDLVLLDLGLPDSQGLDTYLQFHSRCPAVPVVILSGLDDEQIAMQAVRAGAQDYITKGAYLVQSEAGRSLMNRSIKHAIERHRIQQDLLSERNLLETRVEERVSELHQINRRLKNELTVRMRYEFMINTSKDPTILVDQKNAHLAVNDAYCEAHGSKRGQIIGKSVAELWGADNFATIFRPQIERAFTGQASQFEGWLAFGQSETGYYEIFFHPFSIYNEVDNVVIVFHDETSHKASENRVRQHNYRLNVLRQIHQASLSARLPEDVVKIALAHFYQLVSYSRASLLLFGEQPDCTLMITGDAAGNTRTRKVNFSFSDFNFQTIQDGQTYQTGNLLEARPLNSFENYLKRRGQKQYFLIPLFAEGQTLGVLSLSSDGTEPFSEEQIESAQAMVTPLALMVRNAQLLSALGLANQRLRSLSASLISAQEDERRRISLELHDEAGQFLTALKLSLDMVYADLPELPVALQSQITDAARLTEVVIDKLRSLAHGLRPPSLDTVGLHQALADYCQRIANQTGIKVDYRGSELSGLPEFIQVSLYRVVQEALTNVVKHAAATHVEVRLVYDAEGVSLTVQDNGCGFDTVAPNAGIGLLGIHDRIEAIGGNLNIQSEIGRGTRITVDVPLEEAE